MAIQLTKKMKKKCNKTAAGNTIDTSEKEREWGERGRISGALSAPAHLIWMDKKKGRETSEAQWQHSLGNSIHCTDLDKA